MYTYVHVLYILCVIFTGIIYAAVRQISLLFTDDKDSLFCIMYRRPKRLVTVSTAFRADQSAFDRQQALPCVPSSSSDHLPTLGAGWEHGTRPAAAGGRSIQLRSLSWARGCRIASPNKVTLHALSSADDSPPAPQTINISRGWVGGRQIDTPPPPKKKGKKKKEKKKKKKAYPPPPPPPTKSPHTPSSLQKGPLLCHPVRSSCSAEGCEEVRQCNCENREDSRHAARPSLTSLSALLVAEGDLCEGPSFCNAVPVSQPVSQSVSQSTSWLVSQTISHLVSQPVNQSANLSASRPVSQPVSQPTSQSISQPVSPPVSQPTSQSPSQPTS